MYNNHWLLNWSLSFSSFISIFTIKFCIEKKGEKPCTANVYRLQAVVNRVSNIQKMNMQPPEKHM